MIPAAGHNSAAETSQNTAVGLAGGRHFEIIDAGELAGRWNLHETWIRHHTRAGSEDPIPHLRLGRYVRFAWGSPELVRWLDNHMVGGPSSSRRRAPFST
jgi:hypothetical protein